MQTVNKFAQDLKLITNNANKIKQNKSLCDFENFMKSLKQKMVIVASKGNNMLWEYLPPDCDCYYDFEAKRYENLIKQYKWLDGIRFTVELDWRITHSITHKCIIRIEW